MSTAVVDTEFRQRLRLIMQQFGSIADLARAVGVSDNAIYKWVAGRGLPSTISLVNLAKAAGVSVEWLATGKGAAAKIKPETRPAESAEFVSPPRDAIRAGGKIIIQNPQIVDFLKFRPDWLQRTVGVDAKSLALIEAVGDSMAPTVDENDLVLVDLRQSRFKSDGVYVLCSGNDLSIKRIQRQPDGMLVIRSDNPAYQPATVAPDSITLLGRVIWLAGRP
jgi:phage repressor protein C with HTH and peptisase S24 domain